MCPAGLPSNQGALAGRDCQNTEVGKGTLTLRFPSAVIRSRLQVPQKCSDMDVMKLTWPRKPGILKAWARRGHGWRWATECQLSRPDTRALAPWPSAVQPFGRAHPRPSDNRTLWYTDGMSSLLCLACPRANLLSVRDLRATRPELVEEQTEHPPPLTRVCPRTSHSSPVPRPARARPEPGPPVSRRREAAVAVLTPSC